MICDYSCPQKWSMNIHVVSVSEKKKPIKRRIVTMTHTKIILCRK